MKKIFLAFLAAAALAACSDSSTITSAGAGSATEVQVEKQPYKLSANASADEKAYAAFYNEVDVQVDRSGVLYRVISPGVGLQVSPKDTVRLAYVGTHLNGKVFDQNPNITFKLAQLVPGFQIAVSKIKEGGEIEFVIPGHLAYPQGAGNIRPMEPIKFRVKVHQIVTKG